MKRLSHLVLLLVFSSSLLAGDPVKDFVNSPMLRSANISLLVKDAATNVTLCEHRAVNSTTPASTMKVVTAATALEMFGPDFRFETRLSIDGQIDKDGTLDGNLIIHGGGDPTLGSDKVGDKNFLPQWVKAVKAAGIRKINGRIIADESNFELQTINPKWTWEDMGNYYAPAIHGISYLDNTYRAYFRSGRIGTTPELLRVEPEIPGLTIENHLKSSSISFDNAYFYGAPNSNGRTLFGEIPAERSEFPVKGDIPFPGLLLALHLQKCLLDSTVTVVESPLVRVDRGFEGKTIYTHYSPALRDIVTETNVKSNNHYAEYLFKLIGTKDSPVGSVDKAVDTIRKFWKEKGLPVNELFQHDGSGLSPCDAVSAGFFVELLTYMKNQSRYSNDFYNSLPVSGGRGTLSAFLSNTSLEGKVHAKSGTIERVKCYAGYIELKKRTLVFALLVNNPNGTSKATVKKIEEFLLRLPEYSKK